MNYQTFLILIFIGFGFGFEKRQSENPIKEHLIPPILSAETPQWKIEEEELPNTPEKRNLRWLEDAAHFGEFPLGTVREIEKNIETPKAVVVPAIKDTPLQVARHGSHVFVTDEKISNSPLKFISHHHPSLRTVDLSDLADEVNFIFAHPRYHHHIPETLMVLPEDNPVARMLIDLQKEHSFEETESRSAQIDTPIKANGTNNPFETTVLVLPDDNPVKKYLKGIQDKMNIKNQESNQTVESQETQNQEERSATFSTIGHHGAVFVPHHQHFIPTTSFASHQPVVVHPINSGFSQIPHEHAAIFRDSEHTSQQEESNPEKVGDTKEASPTHLHKHKLLHHKKYGPTVIPQNIIHIHQQQSANVNGYQNPGYPRVASPFLVDVPARHEDFRMSRSKRSPTFSRPIFQQQQPQQLPVVIPQTSAFGQQTVFQQPAFAVVPSGAFFRDASWENVGQSNPDMRNESNQTVEKNQTHHPAPAVFPEQSSSHVIFEGDNPLEKPKIQQQNQESHNHNNSSTVSNSTFFENASETEKPLIAEEIEKIVTTIPEIFPEAGGYYPIIQGTSPNGLPLQQPSDDPGYSDLKRIRPVNITALEIKYFNRTTNESIESSTEGSTLPPILHKMIFPPFSPRPPTIKTNHSQNEKSIAKTEVEQLDLDKTQSLRFFKFNDVPGGARSAEVEVEEIVGPLGIFKFSNDDNNDEISVIELEKIFPNDARAADPTYHHHHGGSHFFLHQHGFVPSEHIQQTVIAPTQHLLQTGGHIPFLASKTSTAISLMHNHHSDQLTNIHGTANSVSQSQNHLTAGQHVQVNGRGNSVSQSQVAVQNSGLPQDLSEAYAFQQNSLDNSFHSGQNTHINGEGNSVSQSQSQNSLNHAGSNHFIGGQHVQVEGAGNSVAQSQAVSQNFQRNRRSLVELVNDPNVKVDVPKTISNIGAVAKTSFHDQKRPMYHLNNMVGSIKDVIISTIKIPPQGLIIPSHYRIVNTDELDDNNLQAKHEITRSINQDLLSNGAEESNPDPLSDTFNKFGSAIRESIKASQQTLAHVGDIAHSARQVVHTAKSQAPQIFLPKNKKNPDKVMLVTPKLLEIKNPEEANTDLLQAQNQKDFVKMGDVMDALAVSNPNEETVGVEKIVIERKGGKRKPAIVSRFKGNEEPTLKEFVSKMRGEFDGLVKDRLKQERKERRLKKTIKKLEKQSEVVKAPLVRLAQQPPSKFEQILGKVQDHVDVMKDKSNQVIETIQNVNGKFIDSIQRTISGSKTTPKDDVVGVTHIIIPKNFLTTPKPTAKLKNTNDESDYWDKQVSSFLTKLFEENKLEGDEEVVGAPQFSRNGLNLRPDLMKPFMGRASKASLRQFLKKHGNSVEEGEDEADVVGAAQTENKMEQEKIKHAQKVLGAINPLMFEKLFNETMSGSDAKSLSPYEVFTAGRNKTEETEEQICADPTKVGTSMKITRELLKPFMGRLKGKEEYMEIIPLQDIDDKNDQSQYYMGK